MTLYEVVFFLLSFCSLGRRNWISLSSFHHFLPRTPRQFKLFQVRFLWQQRLWLL